MHITSRRGFKRAQKFLAAGLLALGPWMVTPGLGAMELPPDLQQLWKTWQEIPKQEQADTTWQVSSVALAPSELKQASLLSKEMDILGADAETLTKLKYETEASNGRSLLLKNLFPSTDHPLQLCSAFTYDDYVPRGRESLSAEKIAEQQAKHRLAQCRKSVNKILGGIFHANPQLTFVGMEAIKDGHASRQVVVYISSLINPSLALRYQIQVF